MVKLRSMSNEKHVKENVKRVLAQFGEDLWYFMPPANGYGRSGIPDFLGCYKGKFFAIETKFGSNSLSEHQVRETNAIGVAGAPVWIINNKNIDHFDFEFSAWAATC